MKTDKTIETPRKKDDMSQHSPSYVKIEKREASLVKDVSSEPASERECALPPWLFKHEGLVHALGNAKVVDEKSLTNTLNHIHFMEGHLLVQLRHPRYNDSVLLKARPDPCFGSELTCHFANKSLAEINLKDYGFLHLIIDDGQSVILVPATLNGMDKDGFSIHLPHESYRIGRRQIKRYSCQGVEAELVQGGLLIKGELLDFTPEGLRIRIGHMPFGTFDWSPGSALLTMVHLRRNQQVLFSSLCSCIRHDETPSSGEVVLAPSSKQVKCSERKQPRIPSQKIPLRAVIIFSHPFFAKRIQLDVSDISTSGFSVYEKKTERVLMQGMIIPELTIEFAGVVRMECSAQVIGRFEKDERAARCDFCILDMEINSYSQLCHILANTIDPHTHISKKVDMDALWEFFFETGFIYPKKYGILQHNRERFKETWSKLYQEDLEISKHVTYQKNGRIYGHISMLRAYERTWMIHHHASRSGEGRRAGFIVLKQVMDYLNDMHGLPSAKMDYVMSYFRPQSKFPNVVFGGFARALGNLQGCSMDLFAYLADTTPTFGAKLSEEWTLSLCSLFDLWEFNRFYSNYSGGLLVDAMGLGQNDSQETPLEEVYGRLGLTRKWKLYSLKHEEELNAVLIVDQSDMGFNLSELLNAIKIVVINSDDLSWNVLAIAIAQLERNFDMQKAPILCYPFEYVKSKGVPYEKLYYAWVLNVRYGKEFMEYMYKKFRIKQR